jgi:hypothetical protein
VHKPVDDSGKQAGQRAAHLWKSDAVEKWITVRTSALRRSRGFCCPQAESGIHSAACEFVTPAIDMPADLTFFRCSGCPAQVRCARVRGCSRLPQGAGGCRRCRHGCRRRYQRDLPPLRRGVKFARTFSIMHLPRPIRWRQPLRPEAKYWPRLLPPGIGSQANTAR